MVRESKAQRDALVAVVTVKDAGGRKTEAIPSPGGAAPVWERNISRLVSTEESRGCVGVLCRCCIIVSSCVPVRECRKTAHYRMGLVSCAVACESP